MRDIAILLVLLALALPGALLFCLALWECGALGVEPVDTVSPSNTDKNRVITINEDAHGG